MKTIGINKGIRKMINDVAEDGETVDATLTRLLESVELSDELDSTKTNIVISEETFQKLTDARMYPTEPHISVIFRLIQSQH